MARYDKYGRRQYDGIIRDRFGSPISYPPTVGFCWFWLIVYIVVCVLAAIFEGLAFAIIIGVCVAPFFVDAFKEAYRYR
jgi:hypothetical protein